jgi:hypothetical protein
MLVKSVTRGLKNPELHQLIKYINEKRESLENEPHFCLRYNTSGKTAKEIAKDFEKNNQFIKRRNSKQIGIYHFILSFHSKERYLLDDSKLFDFGQKFCQLMNADKSLAFLRPHWEKDNIHLHCAMSASHFGNGKSRRMSKAKWKEVQIAMNEFQKEHYKELKHSLLYLPELEKSRVSSLGIPLPEAMRETDGSIRAKSRGKISHLDTVRNQLLELAKKYPQKNEFIKAINQEKTLSVYYRGNSQVPTGIVTNTGKKYRFKRLALDIENLQREVRLNELNIQQNKQRNNEREQSLER